MGVSLVYCDNGYDQEKTFECAELHVAQGVDAVIYANWIAGTEQAVSDIYAAAGIPQMTYDGPHPGAIAFGPDNFKAGEEAGKFLGDLATEAGWDPASTALITLWTPDVPVHEDRAKGAKAGVASEFGLSEDNMFDVPSGSIGEDYVNALDWLTANPGYENVLCFGHSDQPGVDCTNAIEASGYTPANAAVASLGASDEALVELKQRSASESVFIGTISFFPERYGQWILPALVDVLEGKEVPDRVIPSVSPVTRDNVEQLYAAGWYPVIRTADQPYKIGYGDGLAGISFTDSVTNSLNEVAEQMGVSLVYCDNGYDQEKTFECAELHVAQGVDAVIYANWIAGTEQAVSDIYAAAGIPQMTYDGPHPGAIAFGPDNFKAGEEAGKFLGDLATEAGWDPASTALITLWTPDVPVHEDRAKGAKAGVASEFGLSEDNMFDVPSGSIGEDYVNALDWLTANPGYENVLCFGHSDQPGVDCTNAIEASGYTPANAAVASLGASDEALVELKQRSASESVFIGTISFFPERYGQWILPALVDVLEGKEVPDRVIPSVSPVTRDNVDALYPEE